MNVLVAISLLMIAILHIYWGHGGLWPGVDNQDLINKVYGQGRQFPSRIACYVVALGLFLGSAILLMSSENKMLQILKTLYAIAFFARGILGYAPILNADFNPLFVRYNRRLYSPLCLVLGAGFVYTLLA